MEKVRAARSESDPRRSGIMSSDGRKTHDRRQGVTATTSARLVLMNNRTELRSRHRAQRGNGKAFALFVCGRRIAAAANIGFSWTTTFHACDRVISRRAPSLLVHQPFHLPSRLAAVILIGLISSCCALDPFAQSRHVAVIHGQLGKSPFDRECVVADAVAVEPVSQVQFPANSENNREF